MEKRQGLINFSQNIKPVMLKCKDGKKLTKDEQGQIVEYYLEVLDYIYSSKEGLS